MSETETSRPITVYTPEYDAQCLVLSRLYFVHICAPWMKNGTTSDVWSYGRYTRGGPSYESARCTHLIFYLSLSDYLLLKQIFLLVDRVDTAVIPKVYSQRFFRLFTDLGCKFNTECHTLTVNTLLEIHTYQRIGAIRGTATLGWTWVVQLHLVAPPYEVQLYSSVVRNIDTTNYCATS